MKYNIDVAVNVEITDLIVEVHRFEDLADAAAQKINEHLSFTNKGRITQVSVDDVTNWTRED